MIVIQHGIFLLIWDQRTISWLSRSSCFFCTHKIATNHQNSLWPQKTQKNIFNHEDKIKIEKFTEPLSNGIMISAKNTIKPEPAYRITWASSLELGRWRIYGDWLSKKISCIFPESIFKIWCIWYWTLGRTLFHIK